MAFSEQVIQQVWEKGRAVNDRPAQEWRKDECGAWMRRDQYENPRSEYGWKIEHVQPPLPNSVEDLRPFHWRNAYDIANARPRCTVTADRTGLAPNQRVDVPRNQEV